MDEKIKLRVDPCQEVTNKRRMKLKKRWENDTFWHKLNRGPFASALHSMILYPHVFLNHIFQRPLHPSYTISQEIAIRSMKRTMNSSLPVIRNNISFHESLMKTFCNSEPLEPVEDAIDVKGYWLGAKLWKGKQSEATLFYIHGGGYVSSSSLLGLQALSYILETLRTKHNRHIRVFAVDYPLAPENPYPSGLNKIERAYHWLTSSNIHGSRNVFLCGDSSGGTLALALLQRLYPTSNSTENSILPLGSILISPWVETSCESQSYFKNSKYDIISGYYCQFAMENYLFGKEGNSKFSVESTTRNSEIMKWLEKVEIMDSGSFGEDGNGEKENNDDNNDGKRNSINKNKEWTHEVVQVKTHSGEGLTGRRLVKSRRSSRLNQRYRDSTVVITEDKNNSNNNNNNNNNEKASIGGPDDPSKNLNNFNKRNKRNSKVRFSDSLEVHTQTNLDETKNVRRGSWIRTSITPLQLNTPKNDNEQEIQEPKPKEPKPNESEPNEPKPNEPEPKEPEPNELKPKEPEPNEPKPKEPEQNEPEPNEPEPNEPKPKEPEPKIPEPNEPKEPEPKVPEPNEPNPKESKPNEPIPIEPKKETKERLNPFANPFANPLISPLRIPKHVLAKFPPLFISYGGKELFKDDIELFCKKCIQSKEANTDGKINDNEEHNGESHPDIFIEVDEDMIHNYPILLKTFGNRSKNALSRMADFINTYIPNIRPSSILKHSSAVMNESFVTNRNRFSVDSNISLAKTTITVTTMATMATISSVDSEKETLNSISVEKIDPSTNANVEKIASPKKQNFISFQLEPIQPLESKPMESMQPMQPIQSLQPLKPIYSSIQPIVSPKQPIYPSIKPMISSLQPVPPSYHPQERTSFLYPRRHSRFQFSHHDNENNSNQSNVSSRTSKSLDKDSLQRILFKASKTSRTSVASERSGNFKGSKASSHSHRTHTPDKLKYEDNGIISSLRTGKVSN